MERWRVARHKKTPNELRTLAKDYIANRIYTSLEVPAHDLRYVFMVLAFLDGKMVRQLRRRPPGLIYEYLHKRGGTMAINGHPMFLSCAFLRRDEMRVWLGLVRRMVAALEGV